MGGTLDNRWNSCSNWNSGEKKKHAVKTGTQERHRLIFQHIIYYERGSKKKFWRGMGFKKFHGNSLIQFLSSVSSVTQSCLTLCDPMDCIRPGFPVHHQLLEIAQTCPSSQWCHLTISSSVVPFSSCLRSFPASGSFAMSQFSTSGSQSIGASVSASRLFLGHSNCKNKIKKLFGKDKFCKA